MVKLIKVYTHKETEFWTWSSDPNIVFEVKTGQLLSKEEEILPLNLRLQYQLFPGSPVCQPALQILDLPGS